MDKDLVKMFKEKNKAILITNLKFDLEKNLNTGKLDSLYLIYGEEDQKSVIKSILANVGTTTKMIFNLVPP